MDRAQVRSVKKRNCVLDYALYLNETGFSTYIGEFKDGNKHGQGTITNPDGSFQRGVWVNDKLQ